MVGLRKFNRALGRLVTGRVLVGALQKINLYFIEKS